MTHLSKYIFSWLIGLFLVYLLYRLIPVFIPFFISAGLAYISNPLVKTLEQFKLSRTIAVSIVFTMISFIISLLLFILVPLLIDQIVSLINKIPLYVDWVRNILLPMLKENVNNKMFLVDQDAMQRAVNSSINTIGNISTQLLLTMTNSSSKIASFAINLMLIPFLTFYLMRDWEIIIQQIQKLIPQRFATQSAVLFTEADEMLNSFFKGQLIVMFCLAMFYSLGLSFAGFEFALLIGMLAGLVSFVPYLGFIVGITTAGIAGWFQFYDLHYLISLGIIFGIAQLLESFILTPKLVGDKLGMHALAVIFALMAGGQLFGFFGILLALPCCAVLMVILRHLYRFYKNSHFYSNI